MISNGVNIGIIFNAIVSSIIAITAIFLTVFLFKRYARLTTTMKAYSWFWFLMISTWTFLSIKYFLIGFGYLGRWIHYVDITLQTSIFLGGLPLIYYISLRAFSDRRLANIISVTTIAPLSVAIWLITQPGGLVLRNLEFFSAKSVLNSGSLVIFNVEVGIILTLLIYDIGSHLRRWLTTHNQNMFYESLYSMAIVVYLVLGSIEQSALITNWTVIIFRILYTATFLFVYLLVTQHEALNEKYLLEEANIAVA